MTTHILRVGFQMNKTFKAFSIAAVLMTSLSGHNLWANDDLLEGMKRASGVRSGGSKKLPLSNTSSTVLQETGRGASLLRKSVPYVFGTVLAFGTAYWLLNRLGKKSESESEEQKKAPKLEELRRTGKQRDDGINDNHLLHEEPRKEEEVKEEEVDRPPSPKTPKATSNSNGGALVRKSPWKLRRLLNAAPENENVLETVQSTTSTHVCSVDEAVRKAGFQDAELEFDEIDEVLEILTEYRDSTSTKALGSDADHTDPLTLQFKSLVGMYDAIIGHLESLKNAMNAETDSVAEELEHTACNVFIKMGFNPHSDGQKLLIQITYKSGFNPGEDSEGTFVQEFTRFISIFNPLGAIDGLGHDDIRKGGDFANEGDMKDALAIGGGGRENEDD